MHQYALLLSGALLVLSTWSASGEPVDFRLCPENGNSKDFCDITNVAVNPCPDGPTECKIKRGKTATLTFDFKPNWTPAGPVLTRAYWAYILDLPFAGMDTDVCKYASCPITNGQQNSYNFTLELSKQYLAQRYDIKFKLWDDKEPNTDDETQRHQCCIIFKLRLV